MYEPSVHYNVEPHQQQAAIQGQHSFSSNFTNIRHGLNGPAIIVQNDVPMAPSNPPPRQRQQQSNEKERITVLAIPSSSIVDGHVVIGDAHSMSDRAYTPVKNVGDGSFGTVWLCDWHSPLPPSISLAPMQQGAGAKAEWQGKRLVAIKRMKKRWEGGWDECRRHPELESLRSIPQHENIIPLYDCFLLPTSKELYFVFECMEGNLYQLIKSRKGAKPFAGGLVSSIFKQVCKGLAHIHDSGYFHRDMKPENLLVTTTGLTDYTSVSPLAPPGSAPERDVVAIIKIADFGLARQIKSRPPYTEYVSTRWYRAPEVLLKSSDYSAPVDLWALGTIMAEVVNLKPLFPGENEFHQIQQICEVLGDPEDYGVDSLGRPRGGGKWPRGLKIAKHTGFVFDKIQPKDFYSLFETSVPYSLIECIASLLRYEPEARLTAHGCLDHVYFVETKRGVMYPPLNIPRSHPGSADSSGSSTSRSGALASVSPRTIPHSQTHAFNPQHIQHGHRHHHPYSNGVLPNAHRQPFIAQHANSSNPDMEMASPVDGVPPPLPMTEVDRAAAHRQNSIPMSDRMVIDTPAPMDNASQTNKSMFGGFGKRWGPLSSMFGHQDKGMQGMQTSLPPVEEITFASRSTPSLQGTPSSSSESRSLPEVNSPVVNLVPPQPMPMPIPVQPPAMPLDPKKAKKEQERLEREAEKEKRANIERLQRERARAVIQKRNQLSPGVRSTDFEFQSVTSSRLAAPATRPKQKKEEIMSGFSSVPPSVLAANSFGSIGPGATKQHRGLQQSNSVMPLLPRELGTHYEQRPKKRRDDDDDHSMSSSDAQSVARMSVISFATVDSDPGTGPNRLVRRQRSAYGVYGSRGLGTGTSISSLQSYTASPRSSHSLDPGIRSSSSIDAQFVTDFERANFVGSATLIHSPGLQPPLPLQPAHQNTPSPTFQHLPHPQSDIASMSPPNLQYLSLAGSPNLTSWTIDPASNGNGNGNSDGPNYSSGRRLHAPTYVGQGMHSGQQNTTPHEFSFGARSHPPTPHSGINPMFQVAPPLPVPATSHSVTQSLPPFSTFVSVAEMHVPPQPLDPTRHPPDQPP